MADDVQITSGANSTLPNGTKFVTDDTGARGHIPVVKLGYSADGVATHVDAGANGLQVYVSAGTVVLGGVTSGTAGVPGSAIAYGTAAGTALAANSARVGYNIVNAGTAVLYVSYAATATTSNFIERLATQYGRVSDGLPGLYTGAITMVGSAAGTAIVTEW